MAPIHKVALAILTICWFSTANAQKSFLVVSDIHLDDVNDQAAILPAARNAGIDTWDTVVNEIHHLLHTQSPGFIIYLGDLPLHVPANKVATAMTNAGITLKELRGIAQQQHIPLLFVPGNNDSPDSDYGKFSPTLFDYDTAGAKAWPVINGKIIPGSDNLYQKLGCYAFHKARLRIIVLNTVLYTWNYHSPDREAECAAQLSWIGHQLHLAKAHHETALIVMHVPPGIDVYKGKTFWTTKVRINETTIQNNFLDTLARYRNSIMGLLASHTHMDGFKRLYDQKGKFITLMISIPAVAPSAYNNTAVKLIRYNAQRQWTTTDTWYHTDRWHLNAIHHDPLNPWFEHMDSTSLFQMVDTLYNTGVKTHNKALDLDVRRN